MKFVVLLAGENHFDRWDTADEQERQAFFDSHAAFLTEVRRHGEVLAVEPLERPETSVTIRRGIATEGPFAETVEQLNGLYLVELPSREHAVDAARLLRMPTVEVRPILAV
jgi:hypothetical protein